MKMEEVKKMLAPKWNKLKRLAKEMLPYCDNETKGTSLTFRERVSVPGNLLYEEHDTSIYDVVLVCDIDYEEDVCRYMWGMVMQIWGKEGRCYGVAGYVDKQVNASGKDEKQLKNLFYAMASQVEV